jgi:hypothetical protein
MHNHKPKNRIAANQTPSCRDSTCCCGPCPSYTSSAAARHPAHRHPHKRQHLHPCVIGSTPESYCYCDPVVTSAYRQAPARQKCQMSLTLQHAGSLQVTIAVAAYGPSAAARHQAPARHPHKGHRHPMKYGPSYNMESQLNMRAHFIVAAVLSVLFHQQCGCQVPARHCQNVSVTPIRYGTTFIQLVAASLFTSSTVARYLHAPTKRQNHTSHLHTPKNITGHPGITMLLRSLTILLPVTHKVQPSHRRAESCLRISDFRNVRYCVQINARPLSLAVRNFLWK